MHPTVYVLARADLPTSHRAVQAVHATIEASRQGLIPAGTEHPYLVVLTVPTEADLERMIGTLELAAIPHCAYREPDLGGTMTALATAPVLGEQRRHFRRWKLL